MRRDLFRGTLIPAIVATAFFMELLDGTIINTSLPSMAASFGVQPLDLSIGITIYIMATAIFVPLSGWLADRFGSRTVFLCSIAIFTVASLTCGLVTNLPEFTAARVIQGLGGALMAPVGRIVVLRNTEKSDLLRATALITWPALLAPVLAPVVGGFITTYASWRWNFLLNVPLGIAGVALVARYIPQVKLNECPRLDWLGLAWSSIALMTLLYGLDDLSRRSENWVSSIAFIGIGIVFGTLAIRHSTRAPAPLIELSALRLKTFALTSVSAGAAYRIAINSTPFLLPLMFQVAFGMDALQSGSLILIYFLGNICAKPFTTPILRKFGFRTVLIFNGVLGGLSMLACATFSAHLIHSWIVVAVLFLAGATRSMQFTALNTLAFADIAPHQRSSSATLSSILQQMAAVFGVTFGAILIDISQRFHGTRLLSVNDFRIAFAAVGALAIVSAAFFTGLKRNAGAEVTGR